jgi:uncharacterized protein
LEHSPAMQKLAPKLADITSERLQSMDDNGISMQILSVTGPGADLLDAADAPLFAKEYNDSIARQIKNHTSRFGAFAHLPVGVPEAAADELERTVKSYGFKGALINGLTNNEFLDNPKFSPIFQRAEQLGVPIYLHPGMPPQAVIDAYYSGLPKYAGMLLSIAGWGWHSETAIHVLRLFASGIFDRYPKLKLIIGHMGEMIPMMMVRCDNAFRPGQAGINQRTLIDTLQQQVHITTSGLFTLPPLITAIDTFGIDNIMFSIDYPFSTNEQGSAYIEMIKNKLGEEQLNKIAHTNADALLNL